MSKIALGTAQFGMDYGVNSANGKIQPGMAKSILSYAQSQGIDLLDTAPVYGDSERVLGRINVDNFKVVTKTRHFNNSKINNTDLNTLHDDFSHSLRSFNQSSIYALLVHNANDLLKPGSKWLINGLNDLKKSKKIKKIGISVYDHDQLKSILDNFDLDIVQLPFNIIDRRFIDAGMLSILLDRGIEVHARSIFLQGLLLMSKHARPNKFERWSFLWKIWHEWLDDNNISALDVTIRYAMSRPEISRILVGVDNVNQLKNIMQASSGELPSIPNEIFTNDLDLLNPSNWYKL